MKSKQIYTSELEKQLRSRRSQIPLKGEAHSTDTKDLHPLSATRCTALPRQVGGTFISGETEPERFRTSYKAEQESGKGLKAANKSNTLFE